MKNKFNNKNNNWKKRKNYLNSTNKKIRIIPLRVFRILKNSLINNKKKMSQINNNNNIYKRKKRKIEEIKLKKVIKVIILIILPLKIKMKKK